MNDSKLKSHLILDCLCIELFKLPVYETSSLGKTVQNLEIKTNMFSGIPKAETFGRKGKFSAFGFGHRN